MKGEGGRWRKVRRAPRRKPAASAHTSAHKQDATLNSLSRQVARIERELLALSKRFAFQVDTFRRRHSSVSMALERGYARFRATDARDFLLRNEIMSFTEPLWRNMTVSRKVLKAIAEKVGISAATVEDLQKDAEQEWAEARGRLFKSEGR